MAQFSKMSFELGNESRTLRVTLVGTMVELTEVRRDEDGTSETSLRLGMDELKLIGNEAANWRYWVRRGDD